MAESRHPKILVLGYSQPNITFLNRLFSGLTENGCEVILATPIRHVNSRFQEPVSIIWTPHLKKWQLFKFLYLLFSLFSSIWTKRLGWLLSLIAKGSCLREKLGIFTRYAPFCTSTFDIIYFPWNSVAITYQGLYGLEKPVIVSCRGSQIKIRPHLSGQEAYLAGLRWSLINAAAIHCVSRDIQREAQTYGLNPEKSVVIQPAVDPYFFRPSITKPKNPRIRLITTGSLNWVKGYEYLLIALRMLIECDVDAELHFLGEGFMRQNLIFTIHDLGLADRVHFHGRLSPSQVLGQLQAADAFVFASLSEGISNAVLEAMSCGLPVISTDCGGMSEAITDGKEGFLVPVRDPKTMADAMYKLASDVDLRTSMGKAGRARVINQFKLEDQVDAFLSLINSLYTS